MKKIIIKRTALILAFVMQFSILLWVGSYILKYKDHDGVITMQSYYAQPENSCDALFLGSSHSGMNLDMAVLWEEYGISAFCLWGAIQPLWNSYHFLVEALKTQTPKVVLLDVFVATHDYEYSDSVRQQDNTVGMRMSKNRLEAIKVTAPKEEWINLIFEYPLYHTRISELTLDDFQHFPWSKGLENDKGSSLLYGFFEKDKIAPSPVDITEVKPITEKSERYLRKIIELSQQKNIPLVLLKTPSVGRTVEQPKYNHIQSIAQEYGVPFLNMNLMDEQTGIELHDYWNDGHMNGFGSRKVTTVLGNYLKERYDLEDHRGDPAYSSWDTFAENTNLDFLKIMTVTEDYVNEILRYGYAAVLIKTPELKDNEQYRDFIAKLEPLELPEGFAENEGCWLRSGSGEWLAYDKQEAGYQFEYDGTDFSAGIFNDTGIEINGSLSAPLDFPGVYLIVYNEEHSYCMDVVSFMEKDQYRLNHE